MKRRAWVATGLFLAGLGLGIAGRQLPNRPVWDLMAGLLFAAAFVLWLMLLPFWRQLAPNPLPGLFTKPGQNERWCAQCGRPTPRKGPCRTCGHTPTSTAK